MKQKSIATVNIIELNGGNFGSIRSFPDTTEGNEAAGILFRQLYDDRNDPDNTTDVECPSEEDYANMLANGIFEDDDGYQVVLVHSEPIVEMTLDMISIHALVNVRRKDDNDMFSHDFTGHVKEKTNTHVIVEDQDGDCFTVDTDQLTFCTDEIMN